MKRRDFIAALAAASFIDARNDMFPSSLAGAENSGDMPYRVLGSTDISFRQY
jgi:hypothetical protein